MTVLLTAATRLGATGAVTQAMGAAPTGRRVPALVLPTGKVRDIGAYAAVVVASAVYGGHWLPSARPLVDRGSTASAGQPTWLSSSGPVAEPPRTLTPKVGADPVGMPRRRRPLSCSGAQGDFHDGEAIRASTTSIADPLHQNQTPAN